MPYKMVMIGGKARMSRPSSVLYPLPSTRCDRKAHAYVNVREPERTTVCPSKGTILPMVRYRAPVFP